MNLQFLRKIVENNSLILAFIFFSAPLEATERKLKPEIIEYEVSGAGHLAERIDEECKPFAPEHVYMIFDFHGVLSRFSEPCRFSKLPRGSMPDYVSYRSRCGNNVAIASGSEEIFDELRSFNLADVLELGGTVEKGEYEVGQNKCAYYKCGKVASFRYLTPTFKGFSQLYAQKAYSPLAVYGNKFIISLLIYIEDNPDHVMAFKDDVIQAPYYQYEGLQKIIIFRLPKINGEVLPQDHISERFLPLDHRTQLPSSDEHSEFIKQAKAEREKPVVLMSLPDDLLERFKRPLVPPSPPPLRIQAGAPLPSAPEMGSSPAVVTGLLETYTKGQEESLFSYDVERRGTQ
ncbi:MAG: hypothetical protein FJX71_04990 [Alphaproteobacteria bacterium]|nr:hypothetical protein [Alphaproteobacteria bacterium]